MLHPITHRGASSAIARRTSAACARKAQRRPDAVARRAAQLGATPAQRRPPGCPTARAPSASAPSGQASASGPSRAAGAVEEDPLGPAQQRGVAHEQSLRASGQEARNYQRGARPTDPHRGRVHPRAPRAARARRSRRSSARPQRRASTCVVVQQGGGAPRRTAVARRSSTPGAGLSRARNVALRRGRRPTGSPSWTTTASSSPGFGPALLGGDRGPPRGGLGERPRGRRERGATATLPLVTTFPVERERVRSGRWTLPGSIGFGVFFAVRRDRGPASGGLGRAPRPGRAEPSRRPTTWTSTTACCAPAASRCSDPAGARGARPVAHARTSWSRSSAATCARGRASPPSTCARATCRAALWLWAWGVIDVLDMAKSALGRRSRLRARLAGAKLAGLAEGTVGRAADGAGERARPGRAPGVPA